MAILPSCRASGPAPISPAPSSPWLLGASLLAWWDAESDSFVQQSGGAVSAWIDAVGGYTASQGTGAAKPTYGTASFNGRPGLSFDGVDDCLTLVGPTFLPTGSTGSEFWLLFDQAALASDTASRDLCAFGTGNALARQAQIRGNSTISQARALAGDGTGTVTNSSSTTNAFGRHVTRYVFEPTQTWVEVDGTASTPSAVSLNTPTPDRLRIGSIANITPSVFAQGVMGACLITSLLTTPQATLLRNYLSARL